MTQAENDLGSTMMSLFNETSTFNTIDDAAENENESEHVEQEFNVMSQIDEEEKNLHDTFNANDAENVRAQEDKVSTFKVAGNRIFKVHVGGVNKLALEDTIIVLHKKLKTWT